MNRLSSRAPRSIGAAIAALALACARPAPGSEASASAAKEPPLAAPSNDELQKLLGPEKHIRDSASFATEKGEPAALVLYVTNVQAAAGDQVEIASPVPLSCPEQVAGIPLRAAYGVALVIDGKLVNQLALPAPAGSEDGQDGSMSLPLRNLPFYNHLHWAQGEPVEYDDAARHTEPTKLLHLADFNGDGKAWEFRLVQAGGACGHLETLVAGYSPARRAAVVFPVVAGPVSSDWSDNFFADPAGGTGAQVEREFPCERHPDEVEIHQVYEYDAAREAWVLKRHRQRDCEGTAEPAGGPVESPPPPVVLAVGSAAGAPGERVSVEVTLDTGDAPAARIAHAIVVDPRISVAAIEGLDFSVASGAWAAADDGIGPVQCASELVESCRWAFSMRLDGDFRGHAVLYQLQLQIPADAAPGAYRLENANLSAKAPSGKGLPVDGKDGELVVRTAPAK